MALNYNNSNKTTDNNGGGAVAAMMMAAASTSLPSPSLERFAAAQKWFLQRETLLDTCSVPISAAAAVQGRRRLAEDSARQILKLLDDLRAAVVPFAEGTKGSVGGGETSNGKNNNNNNNNKQKSCEDALWATGLVEASSGVFRSQCGLEVEPNELRLFDNQPTTMTMYTGTSGGNSSSSDTLTKRLQPLQRVLATLKDIRQLPQYSHLLSTAHKGNESAECIQTLVKSLQDTVEESLRLLERGYVNCACSANGIAAWAEWLQPLLRIVGDALRSVTLERVMEEPRERLRRVTFDVKEKQREQEDAVTDGDMVRSENLYFEKTALLEGMRPLYDQLEQAIERYKHEAAEEPMQQVRTLMTEFNTRLAGPQVSKEQQLKRRCVADMEKIVKRQEEIRTARNSQRANFSVYMTEWDKLFESNRQQQDACLRAIEELEQRLRHLVEERTFLVEDRLEMMTQERQREDDAMAFMIFASKEEEALRTTLQNVEESLQCAQSIGEAVRSGYKQLNRYLQECVLNTAEAQLLDVRKERLDHFRSLYLTLGELQYKKERHVEELEKRIDYYHAQQELAMDTFNPKAKEFSKAKKDLLEVKETMKQQVQVIAQKAAQQLEDFKPTEKLLLASGVRFTHPVEELAEINQRRTQKLLEYHSLMSTMNEEKQDDNINNNNEEEKWDGNNELCGRKNSDGRGNGKKIRDSK